MAVAVGDQAVDAASDAIVEAMGGGIDEDLEDEACRASSMCFLHMQALLCDCYA